MREWLKISFHESGACHIKSYEVKYARRIGTKDHAWRAPEPDHAGSSHLMRIVYDLNRQGARLPRHERVKFLFEEWGGIGSVCLDVYAGPAEAEMALPETSAIIADRTIGNARRIVFALEVGPPQSDLPERISEMVVHLGDPSSRDAAAQSLKNVTMVAYSTPEDAGTLMAIEASAAEFLL